MKRTAHRLKETRKTETPDRFYFFDTETLPRRIDDDTEEHTFRLGAGIYWRRERSRHRERVIPQLLHAPDDLWLSIDDLCEPRTRMVVLAHNTGFDVQACGGLAALDRHGWQVTKAVIDDPPFIVKARRGTTSLLLLDWYNYFRGSLASAGELLDVPKMRMPDFSAPDSEWLAYCRNDVQVLYRAVRQYVEWVEGHDLGNFAYTLAGQALNAYRHRFMPYPIFIHDRRSATELERQAYFGGRVEMFSKSVLPVQPYTYLDINSAYPYVMREGQFPTALKFVRSAPSLEEVEGWLEEHDVIASVELETDTPLYPFRMDARLVFPVGSFITTLPTAELTLALARRHVRRVTMCAVYTRAPIFRTWVDEMYALRQQAKDQGNYFYNEMTKRLMNSLFGKFGQRNYEWQTIATERGREDEIWKELHLATGRVTTYRRLAGVKQMRTAMEEGFNSHVAIAASVTSAARVLLASYIERAGWKHAYYCDTDSLIVDESGAGSLAPLVHPSELGALKVEKVSQHVELLAPKNYRFGDLVRHKGRRNNAQDVGDGRYRQEQFVSLVGAMRRAWQGGPLVRQVVKRDALAYHKGTVLASGRIAPLRLSHGDADATDIYHDDGGRKRAKPLRNVVPRDGNRAHCRHHNDERYCLCDLIDEVG